MPLRSRSTSSIPTSRRSAGARRRRSSSDTLGPGAYRLLNIDGSYGGTNPATLGDWIRDGYDGYMPLGDYYSDPGAKYNTNPNFKSALEDVIVTGQELLFPVYRSFHEQGAGFVRRSSAGSGSW